MKKLGISTYFAFFLIAPVGNVHAQSAREQLEKMVVEFQKTPNDHALRSAIIKLVSTIKPSPVLPEEAREPFVMGTTVLKRAKAPADVGRAIELFTRSLSIAPWHADGYFNRAIANQTKGNFVAAIDDLNVYLQFPLTDNDRRETQDKIYSLKADAELASSKKAEEDSVARAEDAKRKIEEARRDVIAKIKQAVGNRRYDMSLLSSSQNSPFAGVNANELDGSLYRHGGYDTYNYFWKFSDTKAELWATSDNGTQHCYVSGESMGPGIDQMRWFNGCSSGVQWWGYFDLSQAQLLTGLGGGQNRPINDSEFNRGIRYNYVRYSPQK